MASKEFFDGIASRLSDNGFAVSRNIELVQCTLRVVGKSTDFEVRYLNILSNYVLVTEMGNVDVGGAEDFSGKCWRYALEDRRFRLPRPLGGGLITVAVIASHDFNEEIKEWARSRPLQLHLAGAESIMLVSLNNQETFFRKEPPLVLGRAFNRDIGKIAKLIATR
ncbi:MAG: hypothetical protein OK442_01895 [Thaumarchaeota archaeon]|nr:hypothetical protein [Nitrososphaerota archaeon]